MKRIWIVAVAILVMTGMSSSSFAAKSYKSLGVSYSTIEGAVVKFLPDQGAVIVKDNDDGQEIHVHVNESTSSALQIGDVIQFDMQGSNCVVTKVIRK